MTRPDRSALASAALALVITTLLGGCATPPPPNATPASGPRVSVQGGTLEGRVDSATGVLVFDGIPYAAPPVGDLRWRPPQPAARWTGVRPANRLAHNCVQHQPYGDIDPFAAGISEDCLYLNVWTQAARGRRPVMVWIHGGGFHAGFGGEERQKVQSSRGRAQSSSRSTTGLVPSAFLRTQRCPPNRPSTYLAIMRSSIRSPRSSGFATTSPALAAIHRA